MVRTAQTARPSVAIARVRTSGSANSAARPVPAVVAAWLATTIARGRRRPASARKPGDHRVGTATFALASAGVARRAAGRARTRRPRGGGGDVAVGGRLAVEERQRSHACAKNRNAATLPAVANTGFGAPGERKITPIARAAPGAASVRAGCGRRAGSARSGSPLARPHSRHPHERVLDVPGGVGLLALAAVAVVAEDDGSTGRGSLAHECVERALSVGVEARERLVEDDEFRRAQQRLREHDLLQRSLRELPESLAEQRLDQWSRAASSAVARRARPRRPRACVRDGADTRPRRTTVRARALPARTRRAVRERRVAGLARGQSLRGRSRGGVDLQGAFRRRTRSSTPARASRST